MKKKLILYSKVKRNQPDRCRFYKAEWTSMWLPLFNGLFEGCDVLTGFCLMAYHLAQVPKFSVPSGRVILSHVRLRTGRE